MSLQSRNGRKICPTCRKENNPGNIYCFSCQTELFERPADACLMCKVEMEEFERKRGSKICGACRRVLGQ